MVHQIDKSLFLDYSDPRPENRELHLKIADTGFKGGFLTRNESRSLLGDGEALEGGDEFMAPAPPPVGLGLEDMVRKAASDVHPDEVNDEEDSMEANWARRFRKERDALVAYLEEVG